VEQYESWFRDGCGICGRNPGGSETVGRRNVLALDHCHTCGKGRGILCSRCNQSIGQFKDDPERILSAIRYLDDHKSGRSLAAEEIGKASGVPSLEKVQPGKAKAKDGLKRCSTCKTVKPVDEFSRNARANDGLQNVCKDCVRGYSLAKRGLDNERYAELAKNGCSICGHKPRGNELLVMDHVHDETQAFRGLLCLQCNFAIGLCLDEPGVLEKAAQYLLTHQQENPACL